VLNIPIADEVICDWYHVRATGRFGVLPLCLEKKVYLFISDSTGARGRITSPERAMFGKIFGGEIGPIDYPQFDVSFLFDDFNAEIIQISISGLSLRYGTTRPPSWFRDKFYDVAFDAVFVLGGTNDIKHCFDEHGSPGLPRGVPQLFNDVLGYCSELATCFGCPVVFLGAGTPGSGVCPEAVNVAVNFRDISGLEKAASALAIDTALAKFYRCFADEVHPGIFPPSANNVYCFPRALTSEDFAENGTGHAGKSDLFRSFVHLRNAMAMALLKLKLVTGLKGEYCFV
jgi:hypothetical protein